MITKPLLVLKKQLPLLSVLYTITLTVLSLASIKGPEGLPENNDKIFHLIAYFLLTGLWFYTLEIKLSFSIVKSLLIASLFAISFGLLMEFLQQELTENRQADFNDIIANTIGTIIAVLVIIIFKKTHVKNY